MKTFTLSKDQVEKTVEALSSHIDAIRMYNKIQRNRLRHKTTKNLGQRKSDQAIVDRAEGKILEIEKIIETIKK